MSPDLAYSIMKDLLRMGTSYFQRPFVYYTREVAVTFDEKMRSLKMDVIRVNASDHEVGVAAEYAWIRKKYPKHKFLCQAFTTLARMKGKKSKTNDVYFDILFIELEGKRMKAIYFDISNFFRDHASSMIDPGKFAIQKLSEIYPS